MDDLLWLKVLLARTSGLDLRDWHIAQRTSMSRAVRPELLVDIVADGFEGFWWVGVAVVSLVWK